MSASSEVRARLDHPVVDIDGHAIEYFPVLAGFLEQQGVDLASPSLRRLLPGAFGPEADWYALSPEERARTRTARPPWWGSPARNTRDLATALFPALLYERLDELGIDVSVIYPSIGLVFLHFEDERERRGACRALNRCNAEMFAPFADRLVPVAAIPMHTPEEAIDALDDAAGLGFKAVLLAGYVQRPAEALAAQHPDAARWGLWIDQYGIDRRVRLRPGVGQVPRPRRVGGVPLRLDRLGQPPLDLELHVQPHRPPRRGPAHAVQVALPRRRHPPLPRPQLRVPRGRRGVGRVALRRPRRPLGEAQPQPRSTRSTPATSTATCSSSSSGQYGHTGGPQASTRAMPARAPEDPATLDEWAALAIERPEDLRDLFVPNFFFGCEADDPLTTAAFNTKVNPFGARLQAMFGSDIAHWDVPDMSEVPEEAWEMVDHGLITEDDFRDFVFVNPVRFFTGGNPAFFRGTVVEAAVDGLLAGAGAGK